MLSLAAAALLAASLVAPTAPALAQDVAARFSPAQHPISLIHANAGYGGPLLLDGSPDAIQRQVEVLRR